MQNLNSKFKTDLPSRCFKFSLEIIKLADTLPNKRAAWIIMDQLLRSARSVGANLTEGRASSSRFEFKRYYEISLKSANEIIYWLDLLNHSKLGKIEIIKPLTSEAIEILKMLGSSGLKLKNK